MGTNKQTETVPGTELRIKWSATSPFDANQRTRLLMSLSLAQRVAFFAATTLRLWPSSDVSLQKVHASILATHFKLADLGQANRTTIADGLSAISLGLRGNLTIADAFSSTHERAKTEMDRFARMKLDIIAEQEIKAEQRFKATGKFEKYFERTDKITKDREVAKQVYFSERKELWRTAINTEGFVKHRVKGAQDRTDPSAPLLPPEEKNSIHINFHTLLARPEFKSMHVALTLIHEASHKFSDTFDFAYTYEPGYQTLTTAQLLRNADSVAFAAVSIYLRRLVCRVHELYLCDAPNVAV